MKIVVNYNEDEVRDLKISSAIYRGDYKILLQFNDGSEKLVDFEPFLTKTLHPSIKKYLDKPTFSNFKIVEGNLNWNDYELIFPLWDLYKGKIEI